MTSPTPSHVTPILLTFKKKMSRRLSAVSPRVGARRASPPPGATWPTLAPSPPEQPSKQRRRCQPDGAPERRAARWSCDRSFLRRRSWKRKPDPDPLPKTKKEDKDGAQGCSVSRFAFAGLCDNLQQRAMSRRCLPLQQPLRRVSKDPPSTPHSFGEQGQPAERALLQERTAAGEVSCAPETRRTSNKGGP